MNDLHKGRDSGKTWSVIIDVASHSDDVGFYHRNGSHLLPAEAANFRCFDCRLWSGTCVRGVRGLRAVSADSRTVN